MELKKKICISCGLSKYIFSKKRCKECATKEDSKPLGRTPIKKQTVANKEKRSIERAGFGDFFLKHTEIIVNEKRCCQECGEKLQGNVGEVCHIVSKRNNIEVALVDDNILYLCFWNGCHNKFDSNLEARQKMNVFNLALERYKKFKHLIITYSKEVAQLEELTID